MNHILKGWFTELSSEDIEGINNESNGNSKQVNLDEATTEITWSGQAFSLQVDKVLFHEKSKYQDVLVFKSKTYGNVLVLDGMIQCTERDEFAYQEMLAHLPMFAHPNPKKVLIIGGGDGGILREVLKHDIVEHVTMCEIDEMVINVSKKFLPEMAEKFDSPKLNLFIGDGFEFMRNHKSEFDVVITDSTDLGGPADVLFEKPYYQLLSDALREGGVISSQIESPWIDMPLVKRVFGFCDEIFSGQVRFSTESTPTYISGITGYIIASKGKRDVTIPTRTLTDEQVKTMNLKFYNSEIHKASFVLPTFVKQALEKKH
ncbi:hypothetical protein FO519_008388 [Halicephalobus sp. NKZ332]|nr:hypothetical protein FO519_008388 [Halicephalobus sp. NKZ332]